MSGCGNPVLLVEDEDDVREVLRECLALRGYAVVEAPNGQVALDYLCGDRPRPCLILLDLVMPVMDGWEFLDAIRANEAWADIPVVVSTSVQDRVPDRPLLPKPVSLIDFLRTVEKSCQRAAV